MLFWVTTLAWEVAPFRGKNETPNKKSAGYFFYNLYSFFVWLFSNHLQLFITCSNFLKRHVWCIIMLLQSNILSRRAKYIMLCKVILITSISSTYSQEKYIYKLKLYALNRSCLKIMKTKICGILKIHTITQFISETTIYSS